MFATKVQNLSLLRNRGLETVKNLRVSDEVVVAEAERRVVLQESLERVPQLGADLAVVPLAVPVAVLLYRLLPDHINGLGGGEAGAGRRSPVRREVGEVQARVTGPDADMIQWRSLQGNQWALPPLCGVGRKILFTACKVFGQFGTILDV